MTFTIIIKAPAEKWLRKYDKEIQKRFAAKYSIDYIEQIVTIEAIKHKDDF